VYLAQTLRLQRVRLLALSGLILLGIALTLINPQVVGFYLDTAQSGAMPRALYAAAGVFIAFSILQQLVSLGASAVSQVVSWTATNQLRADLAEHCLRLDMPFHKQHTPGELIERIDGDVNQLANYFSQFVIQLLGNGLLVIGILVVLLWSNLWVGLGMTVYALVTLLALSAVQRPATRRWSAARQSSAEQYSYLEERISGAEEIRAAGAEGYALYRLHLLMRRYLEKLRGAFLWSTLTSNLTLIATGVGYAIGLALGIYLYLFNQASIGTIYVLVFYIGMLTTPLQAIREQVQDLQQATASLERIDELMERKPETREAPKDILDRGGALAPSSTSLHHRRAGVNVAFSHVFFHYEDQVEGGEIETILSDIDFILPAGKILGILGRTGSGKSSLTRLLVRLYAPQAGQVRLDGIDMQRIPLNELRKEIGMVTQEVQLFDGTIRNNLTLFDRTIPDDVLREALIKVGLWDWVQSLPAGMDTRLAADGQGLSAGEAQLLSFGRIFLRDPALVILDEASSRLDPVTEKRLETAIDRLFEGRTGMIIAHRLSTVQRADMILILEKGSMVEFGPRQELIANPDSRFASLLKTGLEETLA
jgi:ATP-binding cassette, subfamily B, bacterial